MILLLLLIVLLMMIVINGGGWSYRNRYWYCSGMKPSTLRQPTMFRDEWYIVGPIRCWTSFGGCSWRTIISVGVSVGGVDIICIIIVNIR